MLGRQQIAGIPTAISELFKNAHDAYADCVEIDYYRSDGLFVLRDDGVGMTEDEFIERWLTIGTESKIAAAGIGPPHRDSTKAERPMLGEKGIGRLAIATIGPQLLILTRARREGVLSDLTAAFVNWTLFECAGIDLEDIQIPIRTFPGGELPTAGDVSKMVTEFADSHEHLRDKIGKDNYARLCEQLQAFRVDPRDIDAYLRHPSLREEGSGVHFIIVPSSDDLPLDIDSEPRSETATPFTKALLGFADTMTPNHTPPTIQAAFRDHKTDEIGDDLIAEGEFFTPDEFQNSDHQITGRFDEFGQFMGDVSIFGENKANHIIAWSGARGNPTDCGPFDISLAAIEGQGRHSTLPAEDHARMTQKMGKIGGLYIYRDGVRVLPYGNTDYDWLDIEFHRTKSASYYYFSHRKIFGAVKINNEGNWRLTEKAGREGFRENKAYRQFKSILKNFLLQITADFFRGEGVHGRRFEEHRALLDKMEMDRRRRQRLVSERKQKFSEDLRWFFDQMSKDTPQEKAKELSTRITEKLKQTLSIPDAQQAAQEMIRLEQNAYAGLREIESQYRIARPRMALNKEMQREWENYIYAFSDLAESVFRPARAAIEELVGKQAEAARLNISRELRVEAALDELAKQARKKARDSGTNVKQEAESVAERIRGVASECLSDVEAELRDVVSDFQRTNVSRMTDEEFVTTRDSLESRIQEITDAKSNILDSLLVQLQAIDLTGETSTIDQLVAIEQRNTSRWKKRPRPICNWSRSVWRWRLSTTSSTQPFVPFVNNLRRLKAWADTNKSLDRLYRGIRASFDHLDGYLTLFTPLQRRLYRKAVDIGGTEIYDFLDDLFKERFTRHHIEFVKTRAFAKMKVRSFPSSFYPVFVNLVDNAVYLAVTTESLEGNGGYNLTRKTAPFWSLTRGPAWRLEIENRHLNLAFHGNRGAVVWDCTSLAKHFGE